MGEEAVRIIYPDPDGKILEALRRNRTRAEFWDNLPAELAERGACHG